MKKIILLTLIIIFALNAFSQTNTFPSSGYVGIGTTTPAERLEVKTGSIQLSNPNGYPYGINIDFNFTGGWAREYSFSYNGMGKLLSFGVCGHSTSLSYGYIGGNSSESNVYSDPWMVFLPSGNVGIGTKSPQSRLAVNGTITAQKVKVAQTGWPDYVFDSAYQLPLLSEIERFIQQHKHLPDIPSNKEIESEGLDLGKMQKKQMQKIEEMILYLIKMNKKQVILKRRIEKLESLNQELVKQIQNLKSTER